MLTSSPRRYVMKSRDFEMNFQEIGDALGVTPQRAEQIYTRAIHKLRTHAGVLAQFLETQPAPAARSR